jgi:hypothetical protein
MVGKRKYCARDQELLVHRGLVLGVPHQLFLHGNATADSVFGDVVTDEIGCGRLASGAGLKGR